MSLLKKLAGETAIYGLSSILGRLVNWVVMTYYLTRKFSASEYGIISDLYFWIALLMVFFTYRMETAFFRYGNDANDLQRAFSTSSVSIFASTFGLAGILLAMAGPIATWLHYPGRPEYVQLLISIICLDTLAALPFAKLRMESKPVRFAFIRIINIVVTILATFFFLELCPWLIHEGWSWVRIIYDEQRQISYVLWANLFGSLVMLLLLLPVYLRTQWQIDGVLWKKMIFYAAPLTISGVAAVVNQLAGIEFLKYAGPGTAEENWALAGVYSAASKVAIIMSLFTQAFNFAAEPFFFNQSSKSDNKLIYADVGKAFALVGSLAFLVVVLFMDFIQFFIGREMRTGLGIVPILLISYWFLGLFYSFSVWYKVTDKTKAGGIISSIGMLITFLVNFILLKIIDSSYFAPAWASLLCYGFMAVAALIWGQKHFPIPYPIARMAGYMLWAITVYCISLFANHFFSPQQTFLQGLTHLILLFIYIFPIYYFEKNWLIETFKQKKNK